jgi:gamma-glutamyl-gamma-aminobutyrate hydrolase PuuD
VQASIPQHVVTCQQINLNNWCNYCPQCTYCNVLGGFYSRWMFISHQKLNTQQLNTVRNSSNTRTRPTRTVSEHSLSFLQSESLQTHVGTIHRQAIGPLAHHNGISAYSPSLTCTSPDDRIMSSPSMV